MKKIYGILGTIQFPKRNTRFTIEDFFQIEVDNFRDGIFMFISADIVKIKWNKHLTENCDSIDKYGWKIQTYCYTYKMYYNILICNYKQKPWKNHYNIESNIAHANKCDGFSVEGDINDFIEWMKIEKQP